MIHVGVATSQLPMVHMGQEHGRTCPPPHPPNGPIHRPRYDQIMYTSPSCAPLRASVVSWKCSHRCKRVYIFFSRSEHHQRMREEILLSKTKTDVLIVLTCGFILINQQRGIEFLILAHRLHNWNKRREVTSAVT